MDRGEILRILAHHGVESIVVGGTAAVLNGAPVSTFDLDLVYARSEANVERLLAALAELDALFRGDPDASRRIGRTCERLDTSCSRPSSARAICSAQSKTTPAMKICCPTRFGSRSPASPCASSHSNA